MNSRIECQSRATAEAGVAITRSHADEVRASLRRLQQLIATRMAKQLVAEQRAHETKAGSRQASERQSNALT